MLERITAFAELPGFMLILARDSGVVIIVRVLAVRGEIEFNHLLLGLFLRIECKGEYIQYLTIYDDVRPMH